MRQFFWAHKTNEKKIGKNIFSVLLLALFYLDLFDLYLELPVTLKNKSILSGLHYFWHEYRQFEIVSESNLYLKPVLSDLQYFGMNIANLKLIMRVVFINKTRYNIIT